MYSLYVNIGVAFSWLSVCVIVYHRESSVNNYYFPIDPQNLPGFISSLNCTIWMISIYCIFALRSEC